MRLVDPADVVVEGFRPGVMARLGLDAATLRARRPDLVYVSISAFGQTRPMADVAGHDLSIQGVAGLLDIERGEEDGSVMPRLPLAEMASGTFAALGIVVALLSRASTGRGATVDVSMLDCLVSWMAPFIVPALNGMTPAPLPPRDPAYGLFATADHQQITISIAGEDHIWRELCAILDLGDLAELEERERVADAAGVQARLRAAVARYDLAWLTRHLEARKITFGPVCGAHGISEHAQVIARGIIQSVTTMDGLQRHYVRQPLLLDGDGGAIKCAAPRLGQHTEKLLAELAAPPAATRS